jgi:hypothetical protein
LSVKIKLIKGLSYRGGKDGTLRATKDKPFCIVKTMEEARAAIATGHFQFIEEIKDKEPEKNIGKMTKDELEDYAAEIGIDISGCKNNDERKEAIKKALEEAEKKEAEKGKEDDSETDGEDAGSKIPFEEE